jgi:transposase
MERIDLRKLNNDELLIIRKQVVRLKTSGKSLREIETLTGVWYPRVSEIWRRYTQGGMDALKPLKSGRKKAKRLF